MTRHMPSKAGDRVVERPPIAGTVLTVNDAGWMLIKFDNGISRWMNPEHLEVST